MSEAPISLRHAKGHIPNVAPAPARPAPAVGRCAARLKIKRHTLAQNAIEAAIEAIERNGYRLSLPLQFRFPNESEAEKARYPQEQEVISRAEERGPAYTVKRRKTN